MNQRGAIIPLIAVLLLVIVVCVAFVVDLGHVHNVKAELQRAVDAAALAGARQLPNVARVRAVARAAAAQNTVDRQPLTIARDDNRDVILGLWNKENLTATPSDRFTPFATNPNAVYVQATRNVDHAFFFFIDATEVTADAIALAEPINPVMPLAIVSCIPLDRMTGNPGELPGTSVCDLNYYAFTNDLDDNAAWTSLTLQGGADNIREIIEDPEDRSLFEQLIFGYNLNNNGLENSPVVPGTLQAPPVGCSHPMGTDINCGLGMINGIDTIAPPSQFPNPAGFPTDPVTMSVDANGVFQPYSSSFDPLFGYAANGALPRWYNFQSDGTFRTDDHFLRLWSQDGILLKGPEPGSPAAIQLGVAGETFAQYQARLGGYYEGTLTPPAPFNDGRFRKASLGGYEFIKGPDTTGQDALSVQARNAIASRFGVPNTSVRYWPNFMKVMRHAGYPPVGVTNGAVSSLLDAFFSLPEVASDSNLQCTDNPPLDSDTNSSYGGQTLRLQAPVIFTGFCEEWQALSNASQQHTLVYVGLSDFLMTRAWKPGQNGTLACPGPDYISVAGCPQPFYPPDGGGDDYPPIPSGGNLAPADDNISGFEGLSMAPRIDEASASSTVRVLLVE